MWLLVTPDVAYNHKMVMSGRRLCSALVDDFLHPAHFAGLEPNFNAMRVMCGVGQNVLHDPARPFPRALILFLDDVDLKPRFNVLPILTIHFQTFLRKPICSPGCSRNALLIMSRENAAG